MKLHERSEYEIDLALRLSLIKTHFNLKFGQDFTFGPRINWDGMDVVYTKNMKISIKCRQNWVEISLRLDWSQLKIYQLYIYYNKKMK